MKNVGKRVSRRGDSMKIEIGNGGLSLLELSCLADGTLRAENAEKIHISRIATDSREMDSDGTLFLGIRGERVDGNDFAPAALQNGAAAVLCERLPETGAGIAVANTVRALGILAARMKSRVNCRTVAVTGSVGKTTTKELIACVLAKHFRVHASKGNYNSDIGVPMSVLEMPDDAEAGIFELGMSALGEIEYLSKLVRPNIGVITNIGSAHMESLGSRENIARAKLEILSGMEKGGTVLLNGDEPLLQNAREKILSAGIIPLYISVSTTEAMPLFSDFHAENIRVGEGKTTFDLRHGDIIFRDLSMNVMGAHWVYAASYATAVGILLGMSDREIRAGLLDFRAAPMRQSIEQIGDVTVIEDCYNASPESMRAALDVADLLRRERGGRLIALLGDMRELGETSHEFHRSVGLYAAQKGADLLYTFGSESSSFLSAGAKAGGVSASAVFEEPDTSHFEAVGSSLCTALHAGDILLVKASRALRAERIVTYLKEQLSRNANENGMSV